MPTPYIAARVYLKPLLPDDFSGFKPEAVLRTAQRDLLKRVKAKLIQSHFSERAKIALAASLSVQMKQSSLIITAKHPAFGFLLRGQKKGQMRWLVKAKRPIPIITETGELIFRSATPRSMANGSWIHPGREPSDFVEKAKQEARAFVKKKLLKDAKRFVRERLAKAMNR